jgi:hypothetical protein
MPTVYEQHISDLAAILASSSGPAVDAVVGATPLRLIREPGGMVPDAATGVVQVERQNLFLLYEDLGFMPMSNTELVIDGERWIVESVPWRGSVLCLVVYRYLA